MRIFCLVIDLRYGVPDMKAAIVMDTLEGQIARTTGPKVRVDGGPIGQG
jgi:hypothetical protein